MTSYKQNQPPPGLQYRKPLLNFSRELNETSEIPNGMIWDSADDFKHANEQLLLHTAALQTQNKELKAYASMVAHDLKDPLTIMVMTSDLIIDVPDLTSQELKEYMQQIRFTAYEMNSIINNLLLFAGSGRTEAPLESVDMANVVAKVQDRLRYIIEENRTQIDFPGTWPDAIGYGPWIEEVWANYISNAIRHGGQPPYVELGASTQPDGMVRFWTRDNGPGLPPEARAHLFTPFSDNGHSRNPGHGLGLSIVLQIVEKLGGQVGVESELGEGSLFFFTLPACSTSKDKT